MDDEWEDTNRKEDETRLTQLFDFQSNYYCSARNPSIDPAYICGTWTHIRLLNIHIEYIYKYKIRTQEQGPYTRYTDVNQRGTLHRSPGNIHAWVPMNRWRWKHDVYDH